jgi:hypothetical protein
MASGAPVCIPAGSNQDYSSCVDQTSCAPADECVNGTMMLCCLHWCNVALNDCGGLDTCTPLMPAVYVNGTQYGVCFDGFSC